MSSEEKQSVSLTREELYQRVWEMPMRRLAESFGVTGTGLAKICKRLDIPSPPRGYWNKKAAGHNVSQYPLEGRKPGVPDRVTISPTPAVTWSHGSSSTGSPPPAVAQLAADATAKVDVRVRKTLTNPHPIIDNWLIEHSRQKEKARLEKNPYLRRLFVVPELTPIHHRRHRILDALFKAVELQGARIRERDNQLYAEVNGHELQFFLEEKERQYRRELTKEERARRYVREGQKWTQVRERTGKLFLKIKSYSLQGLRTEWLETDEHSIEDMLPEIVGVIIAAGSILEEEKIQRHAVEERRREEERRRYEIEQCRKRDRDRWRRFVELARGQEEADLAKIFLARLRATSFASDELIAGRTLSEWIGWAEDKISEHDLIGSGAETVFEDVASVNAGSYRT